MDPREKVPPRPQGQRTEPPQFGVCYRSISIEYSQVTSITGILCNFLLVNLQGFPGFNWGGDGGAGGGGVQVSFGIGAFPFTMFASTLNFGMGDRRPAARKFWKIESKWFEIKLWDFFQATENKINVWD